MHSPQPRHHREPAANYSRPEQYREVIPSGTAVTINFPLDTLVEIAAAGHVDGLKSLDQVITHAAREYIVSRTSAPTFPQELADARERNEIALLQQQHPEHPSAPKDII